MRRITWKSWVILAVLLFLAVFAWRRWGPYPITNPAPAGSTIVAFGDSLTVGVGAPDGFGYVNELEKRVQRPILNSGVSGDTTADALRRLDRDVLAKNPAIVLVFLGGNDQLRQVPTDVTIGNLKQIITRIQERGALVILIGLGATPLNPMLGGRYRSLARETGCPLVPDVLEGIFGTSALMADQIHPNAQGHKRVADRIEPVLREYLEPQR